MSVEANNRKIEVLTEEDLPMDWERIAILGATLVILFFYTRASPFPAGTYWDLLFARDFDLNIGWALLPEALSYTIVQTSASLIGLKTVYHIAYFLLCAIVAVWAFKGKEILPGIVVLGIFAFGLQPILTLRWTLQLLFLAGLISMFDGPYLKDVFGVALIPVTAAASALGLNSWLLLALIVVHVLVNDEFRLSLILCGLMGILFFPEGAASSVAHAPLSTLFQRPDDAKMLTLLGGIFLVPNLLALPRMGEEDLPSLIFYALTGILSLVDPSFIPCFILVGTFLIFLNLADIEPLSTGTRLVGILLLAVVLHVSLFLNPIGFSLNPTVRGELGSQLATLMTTNYEQRRIDVHEMGELAWKGLVQIDADDLPTLLAHRSWPITIQNKDGTMEWYSDLTRNQEKMAQAGNRQPDALPTPLPLPLHPDSAAAQPDAARFQAHTLERPIAPGDQPGECGDTTPDELMAPPPAGEPGSPGESSPEETGVQEAPPAGEPGMEPSIEEAGPAPAGEFPAAGPEIPPAATTPEPGEPPMPVPPGESEVSLPAVEPGSEPPPVEPGPAPSAGEPLPPGPATPEPGDAGPAPVRAAPDPGTTSSPDSPAPPLPAGMEPAPGQNQLPAAPLPGLPEPGAPDPLED
ncbi:MAG: hypothetical protein GX442_17960 [Candidatus Riflebacteria bacterium]|nr:hypothetical protein [Candidatus Riflebacteria bacterium]